MGIGWANAACISSSTSRSLRSEMSKSSGFVGFLNIFHIWLVAYLGFGLNRLSNVMFGSMRRVLEFFFFWILNPKIGFSLSGLSSSSGSLRSGFSGSPVSSDGSCSAHQNIFSRLCVFNLLMPVLCVFRCEI